MLYVLPYHEIDKQKWDACIANASNGLIYSNSFYLDAVSPGWGGIILDDYATVMPLTCKRKWGIKYLAQPPFFQQGGVTGNHSNNPEVVEDFLKEVKSHYKYGSITLNYFNQINHPTAYRNNYLLALSTAFEPGSYFLRNLKKANNSNLHYRQSTNILKTIQLFRQVYAKRLPNLSCWAYRQLEKISNHCSQNNNLMIREVVLNDEILAAVLLLKFKNRWYNILPCLTDKGRSLRANYFLYKNLIDEISGSNMILDFEGSDIDGIEFFYKKITETNQPYPFVHFNTLPKIIRLIKP